MKENHRPSEQRISFLQALLFGLCILVVALTLPLTTRAQDTGYISGAVTDKSGAAVVGAEVVLTSAAGSFTRTTGTNTDGAYVIAGLPGGTYNLAVTAKGFQKYSVKGIVLDVAQKSRIDVQLTVGAVTETVEVTGEAVAQVETTSSDLSNTITGKQIDNLIMNGRNFTQLVNIAPGVVSQTGQDEGRVGVYGNVAYSMNGGRTEYNNWELDGGDNMDNGSNSTLNVYPNPEAIAEFKVLTSNYGAQYGRNGSGTVEVETKSGGSSFHGSAFEYLRNEFFNAKDWRDGADPASKKPPYKKHDFGYTVSGPVFIPNHYNADKKKTFFFFSEEWRRNKVPNTTDVVNVPSDAERTGDFSDVCPGSDCPSVGATVPISPVGQALLSLIPKATPGLLKGGFPAVVQTVTLPETWREELIRIDHNITDNYRLTFRYIHDSWQTQTENPLWGNGTNFNNINTEFAGPGTSFVARLNANISPTLLNEFVASYTADHIFLSALHNPSLPSGFAMGTLFPNQNPLFGGKLPAISLGSNPEYGVDSSLTADTGYFPWNNANPVYTYRDNMTKIHGTHTLTFGVYAAFAQKNEDNSPYVQGILNFDSSNSTVSSGNAFADLLMGNIASYQQWNLTAKYYNRYRIVEPYLQDDWRATKRLTLNLGLRLSLFGTYRERYRHAFNFEPTAFNPSNTPALQADGSLTPGVGNALNGVIQCGGAGGTVTLPGFGSSSVGPSAYAGCLKGHLFNPAPRIGFAFDPKGDGKMAIRGGYGIFFEHTNGNEGNSESLEGSAPYALNATQVDIAGGVGSCPGASSGYSCIGGTGAVIPVFPLGVSSIPSRVIWPYVQQWHLDVEKELPSHVVVTASYVGSKGTHLTQQRNFNQLPPVLGSANPYKPGEPIDGSGHDDCATGMTPSGIPVTGQAAVNLGVACGNDPNPSRPFLGYGDITRIEDQANSIYHALQATARRTVGDLTLSLAYTYSHSIDDSSDRFDGAFVNSYNVAANRGNSSFDQRHNLAISYVYALPLYKGTGLGHTVLGGWQISGITVAQTGQPFSVSNGTPFNDNAGVANGVGTSSRPDLIGNPNSGVAQTDIPGIRGPLLYNPGAFALPRGLTFGNLGRDTLFFPGRLNFDFGLFKRFSFGENKAIDFRWENFNLFNHTQYDEISGAGPGPGANVAMDCSGGTNNSAGDPACIASSSFLHATNAHFARRMQFGLRFQF